MNVEVKVNILPWNEFRVEYQLPEESIEIKEVPKDIPPGLSISKPSIPSSEPYVSPPSTTAKFIKSDFCPS